MCVSKHRCGGSRMDLFRIYLWQTPSPCNSQTHFIDGEGSRDGSQHTGSGCVTLGAWLTFSDPQFLYFLYHFENKIKVRKWRDCMWHSSNTYYQVLLLFSYCWLILLLTSLWVMKALRYIIISPPGWFSATKCRRTSVGLWFTLPRVSIHCSSFSESWFWHSETWWL